MAIRDFQPKIHPAARSDDVWQIVDIRFKRRVADGAYTLEAEGAEGGPGVFARGPDGDSALEWFKRIIARLEELAPPTRG